MRRDLGCLSIVSLTVALLLPLAAARAASGDALTLRGFGTLGWVHSSDRRADFVSSPFQNAGAGHSRHWDIGVDSRFALQVDARFDEDLSGVVQVVTQRQHDGSYRPRVEWANLKYQITPDFDVRLGRTVLATFAASDTRLVGYANPWLRPPLEVYGLLPVTSTDGIDGTYRFALGPTMQRAQLSFGRINLDLPGNGMVKARGIVGFNHTIEYGSLSLRAGYLHAHADVRRPDLDALFAGFDQFGATLASIPPLAPLATRARGLAARYRFVDKPISAFTLGANYERDAWLLIAEWGRLNGPPLLGDTDAWAVTAGHRFESLMPYFVFSERRAEPTVEPGLPLAGLPPPLAQAATALNGGLQQTLTAISASQRSTSLGLRWEAYRGVAVTLQYDRVQRGANSVGTFVNRQPGFEPGGRANVFGLAVHFVF